MLFKKKKKRGYRIISVLLTNGCENNFKGNRVEFDDDFIVGYNGKTEVFRYAKSFVVGWNIFTKKS